MNMAQTYTKQAGKGDAKGVSKAGERSKLASEANWEVFLLW